MNILEYNYTITALRDFFRRKKNFVEVPVQSRTSILAACEDPKTISKFTFSGTEWPLPQTGQMWLEHELLNNPDLPGVFCISTSYRDEPNPVPGRHDKIFPMFEFESHGNMGDLERLEMELIEHLGFVTNMEKLWYDSACTKCDTRIIEAEHEEMLCKDAPITLIHSFPRRTHPFWNMKQSTFSKDLFNKIDIIIHGMETIGSAERSCNPEEMRENFYTISNGEYAGLLFKHFGKERVELELNAYLDHKFFPRFGGGIGITRLIRGMKLSNICSTDHKFDIYSAKSNTAKS